MHTQRRASSYSNIRTLLERDLEEERQALREEQKQSRIRAQKFSTETNRRRKALEEKRKEEEEKELRFREEVLRQRKLKLQEATEKFQRAHLPPSQRRRTVHTEQRKPVPRLEDALEQIQGSFFSPANRYSPTRTVDSPPATILLNGSWFQKHAPSNEDYDKIIQENVGVNFHNNQIFFKQHLVEAQRLLEDQQFNNLQEFNQQINHLTHSESLSSVDSLEDGEEEQHVRAKVAEPSIAAQENSSSYKPQRPQSAKPSHLRAAGEGLTKNEQVSKWLQNLDYQNNGLTPPNEVSDKNMFNPKDEHLKNRNEKSNVNSEKTKTDLYVSRTTPASENNNSAWSHNEKEEKVLPKTNTWVSQSPAFEMVSREKLLGGGSHARKTTNAWVTPDPAPRQTIQVCTHEDSSENMHPSRSTSLPTDQGIETPTMPSREHHPSSGSYPSVNSTNYTQERKPPKDVNSTAIVYELDDAANENNIVCHSLPTDQTLSEKSNNNMSSSSRVTARSHMMLNYNNEIDRKDQKENAKTTVASSFHAAFNVDLLREQHKHRNIEESEGTNLLKGILKKCSKYENGYSQALLISRGVRFANQNQAGIRDSLELTKVKGKDTENQKGSRKLRWFDELDNLMAEDEENACKSNVSGISETQTSHYETKGHSDNMNLKSVTTGANCGGSNNQEYFSKLAQMTAVMVPEHMSVPVISTGYHFAKQAWLSSKGENGTTSGNNSESQKNNTPKGKTKVVRRPKSAKTPTDSGYKTRKGTVIRPQSAIEANKVIKTQGKLIMPHPPPKPVSDNRAGQNVTDTVYQSPQADYLDARDTVLYNQYSNKGKPENNSSSHNAMYSNNSVIAIPSPPSYSAPAYETVSKTLVTVNTIQTVAQKDSPATPPKRGPIYGENGLRLDRTPTDEEITLLWHGVRNALAHKDYSTGDLRPYDQNAMNPYILQSSRPNLSHLTIDGGSLINTPKSVFRMSGFFNPPYSAPVVLSRRKQILDSNDSKRRALLEQRSHPGESSAWRPNLHSQSSTHNVQINPFQYALEHGKTMNGLSDAEQESTSQFLMAENMVGTPSAEGELLAVMESMKPSKQNMLQSKAQRLGISALSLEEQKLLHSLDRLNQRLQYVQDAIIRNPSTAGVLQITSPMQYASSQPSDTALPVHRYRSMSADNRTRLQRKV
ncbi:centrosomal protein of 126 kDa isoform X1 [Pleurodeles waltl]|uniref:centrosomal protein of 126 kDa isoform X1 n=1 Tax=Pleurodeles waltl TaxID=8319 RepID=UPI003709BCF0